jgi:hypothetical protein
MMNTKRLCLTLILTFMLATSALAGTMEIGEIAPPSAPAIAQGSDTTTSTSSTTGDAVSAADVSATEGALGLVGAVLALF